VRCPEREFRRRARGSSDVARPAAGGFLTSRKAKQGNARCSAVYGRNLQPAQACEGGEGEPGWRQSGKPAESAPKGAALMEALLAAFQQMRRAGERRRKSWSNPELSFAGPERERSTAMPIEPAEPDQAVPAARVLRRSQGLR